MSVSMATKYRSSSQSASPAIWYFAYGSNMKRDSMSRRGIEPLEVKVVQVPSHYVTFDIFGIPYSEPSYASLEEFPEQGRGEVTLQVGPLRIPVPQACGVAYLLSPADCHRLLVTEGSGVVYKLVQVEAKALSAQLEDHEKIIVALTLVAKHPLRPNGAPSARYISSKRLFVEGAEEHGLPQSYIEHLQALPRYGKSEDGARSIGEYLFQYGWRPFLRRLVRLTEWNVDADGNCPQWVATVIVASYKAMWMYHDWVHRHVFDGGDGGKLHFTGS